MAEPADDNLANQPPSNDSDALVQQVLRYLSDEPTAEMVAELGDRLRADPAARELFIRMCLLESWLTEKFAPGRREYLAEMVLEVSEEPRLATSLDAIAMRAISAVEEDEGPEPLVIPTWPKPVEPPTPWWQRRRTWFAVAAMLLVGVGIWTVMVLTAPRPDAPLVATLTGAQDVRWHDADHTIAVGASLPAATEIRMRSGLARLMFRSGAEVVVEGPARFTPESDGRLTLKSGRLTALVPPKAKGFTVKTPTAEVVDLGTEFGVDAPSTRGSTVEVQVFDGRVTLQPAEAKSETPAPPQLVTAGEGARIDPAGTVTSVPANPSMFVRVAEAEAIERASQGSSYDRWAAYRYDLARDPDVVAYYPFESDNMAKAADRLVNVTAAGTDLDGTLTGESGALPKWVAGRWPKKAALAFGGDGFPRVLIDPTGAALDFSRGEAGRSMSFTVAVWAKVKPVVAPGVSIVTRGAWREEQFAIDNESAFYRGLLRDGTQPDATALDLRSRNYVSQYWHHAALAYDALNGVATLYVDGVSVATSVVSGVLRPTTGPVMLGCRAAANGQWAMPVDGLIDELVFLRRPMSAAEIRRMYEAGKPD
jgi:hypothetical protein